MLEKELNDLLDQEAAASEATIDDEDDGPIPAHVKVSRPNRARAKVLQVYLNPEEFDALERLAEARGLPMTTVARAHLLGLLKDHQP